MRLRRRHQRGAVMVEFALSMLLLAILIFGVIEFAFALFQWTRVVDATREGARAAIVSDVACNGDLLESLCEAGSDPIVCVDLADDSPILAAMNRRKLGITGSQVTVTYSCSTAGFDKRLEPIPEVKVEADWQHSFLAAALTLGPDREDSWAVQLPSFATTRLGEDLHSPSE